MRTKALLCAAALAVGAFAASAQVYSLNVVGYVNIPTTNGYTLMANQLDADGSMTNNTLGGVLGTNFPGLSKFITYTKATGYISALFSSGAWNESANPAVFHTMISPGRGGYLYIRAGQTPPTVTLVGQVIQGTNSIAMDTGYTICSSVAPISGGLQTTMGLTGHALDKILKFDPTTQQFSAYLWSGVNTNWGSTEPTVKVGESIFYYARSSTNLWTQSFTVQ